MSQTPLTSATAEQAIVERLRQLSTEEQEKLLRQFLYVALVASPERLLNASVQARQLQVVFGISDIRFGELTQSVKTSAADTTYFMEEVLHRRLR